MTALVSALLAPLLAVGLLLPIPSGAGVDDEPRRFWVKDTHRYSSPWYAGERR